MKITNCDICGKEMDDVMDYDLDFASIDNEDIRLLFDCDICIKCLHKAYLVTYRALKTHFYSNIKIQGTWNNFSLLESEG